MEKFKEALLLAVAVPLVFANVCFADEIQVPGIIADAQTKTQQKEVINNGQIANEQNAQNKTLTSPIINVSNKSKTNSPVLVAPVVKEPISVPKGAKASGQKLNLRAIIFDPNADFKAEAEQEGREMTNLEAKEDEIHEALHGEVKAMSKYSRAGILDKYLKIHPESGPFSELYFWGADKGYMSNIWSQANYKNTTYNEDSIFTVVEGTFRNNPKLTFRSMYLLGANKEGHDFMNDMWGDQYLMYHWSKEDQILVGYSRNAGGTLEGGSSPLNLPFFNRSQMAKAYNNVRALGAKAQGFHKMYDYNFGVFSAGRYFKDWFPGPEFIGQFGIKPLGMTNGKYGNLLMGGSIDAGNAEESYTVTTAFIDYEYKRWNATIEYGKGDGSNGCTGFSPYNSEGLTGTLAYRITPKIQVLTRYDQFDPNQDKTGDMRREYTVGLNYFIKEQTIKLVLNYVFYSVENGTYGSKILAGTQFIF